MISFRNSLCYPKPTGSSDHSAGNILRKTVNGKTTVYTYDDANQLMTSTKDGKVTTYKYDSAGRMIQEGAKTYRYGYLDKILNVDENGENVASFTYHMDGQIASAKTKSGTESFLWDGLALIGRDKTQYINEPYVTGGNPILANDKVLFNDILGTTLGVNSDKYAAIPRDAFGMTEQSGSDEFFTGKPYIGELGYAFLFRNYRAEQGKWQTSDPLGYPDGWNNLAYCGNKVTTLTDFLGLCTAIYKDVYYHPDGSVTKVFVGYERCNVKAYDLNQTVLATYFSTNTVSANCGEGPVTLTLSVNLGLAYILQFGISVSASVTADLSGDSHKSHNVKGFITKGLRAEITEVYFKTTFACGLTDVSEKQRMCDVSEYTLRSSECRE